jgi:hypothetical protein
MIDLPEIPTVTLMDYSNKEVQIKVFTPESLQINHEHSTQSNSFALRLSNDKIGGVYVEVGSSHYKKQNHTYFLEKEFGWTGVGIEIESNFVEEYNKERSNPCILGDAITFNWDRYFEENNFPSQIDYLCIDTDGSNLRSLMNIPFSRYRFNTIVVEFRVPNMRMQNPEIDVQKTMHSILNNYNYTFIGSGYGDDYWIDNTSLRLSGNQYDGLTYGFWNQKLR